MKNTRLLLLTVIATLIITCNKQEDTPGQKDVKPEPTPVGELKGLPSVGVIGPEGGSLSTADGRFTLEIPEGALSSATSVEVQPVTNKAPGGIGDAYRFGPEGTQLLKPVTLKFKYTDEDVAGSLPMFLQIAAQDTDRIWYDLRTYTLDTVNKIIQITTDNLFSTGNTTKSGRTKSAKAGRNFLDHATFLDLYIVPPSAELKINESQEFVLYAVENHSDSENPGGEEDYLPPLPTNHEVSPSTVKKWSVNGVQNGNAQYGTVNPNGAHALYKAPAQIPASGNPVQLTADIKLWYKDPATGKDFNNLKINAPITIIGEQHKYQLKLSFLKEDYGAWAFYWKLEDVVTMDVVVTNGIVSVSNIKNENGVVTPTTQTKESIPGVYSCTATVEEYKVGSLNITGGKGNVLFNDLDPNSPWLDLQITNNNWAYPKIKEECNHNGEIEGPFFLGGEINTQPNTYFFRFVLTNEIQTKNEANITTTLTPKTLLPE